MKRIAAHLRPNGTGPDHSLSTAEEFQELIVVDAADRPDLKSPAWSRSALRNPEWWKSRSIIFSKGQ